MIIAGRMGDTQNSTNELTVWNAFYQFLTTLSFYDMLEISLVLEGWYLVCSSLPIIHWHLAICFPSQPDRVSH